VSRQHDGVSLPLKPRPTCRRGLVDLAFLTIVGSPDLSVYPSAASAHSIITSTKIEGEGLPNKEKGGDDKGNGAREGRSEKSKSEWDSPSEQPPNPSLSNPS